MIFNLRRKEIAILKELYLYANTPYFLYKRYADLEFIENKISAESSDVLLAKLRTRLIKDEKSLEDISIIYAIVISLIYKDYNSVLVILKEIKEVKFEWVSKIADLIIAKRIPETEKFVDFKNQTESVLYTSKSGGSSTITIKQVQPDIKVVKE